MSMLRHCVLELSRPRPENSCRSLDIEKSMTCQVSQGRAVVGDTPEFAELGPVKVAIGRMRCSLELLGVGL